MGNVKAVVAFGETGLRFIEFAKSCGVKETVGCNDVEDAVGYAAKSFSSKAILFYYHQHVQAGINMIALKFVVICLLIV